MHVADPLDAATLAGALLNGFANYAPSAATTAVGLGGLSGPSATGNPTLPPQQTLKPTEANAVTQELAYLKERIDQVERVAESRQTKWEELVNTPGVSKTVREEACAKLMVELEQLEAFADRRETLERRIDCGKKMTGCPEDATQSSDAAEKMTKCSEDHLALIESALGSALQAESQGQGVAAMAGTIPDVNLRAMAHYVQVQHDAGGGGASQTKKSEPSAKEAAQELIAQVCKSMALPDEVALAAQDRCVDVHLKAARNVPFGARGAKEAFALACILQSCRALNVPRTLNDILGQRACQCPGKKMLGKWLKCVQSTLGEELRPVDASQLLSRYCEILEVSEEPAMRELQRTLLTGVLDGRTENVKAAAAVVRACGVNSEAVADAAGVSKGSLDSALRLWPTSWEKKDA